MGIPYDFFQKVEQNLKYVLYGDTDSLYINIPQLKITDSESALEKATEISTEINNHIKSFMDKILLPKMGVDPIYNHTNFKTELVADAILLLDIKKNYAYKMLVDEGKVLPKPKIKYTNLSVKKSDVPKFTKEFITRLVEDILFEENFDYNTSKSKIIALVNEMRNKLKYMLENHEYNNISTPKKWGTDYKSDPYQIISMKFYNTLMNKTVFKQMSAGLILPLRINNYNNLETKISSIRNTSPFYLQDIPIAKVTKIAIPYNYEKEIIKKMFEYYSICIDLDEVWNLLLNKTLRRIIEVSKTM